MRLTFIKTSTGFSRGSVVNAHQCNLHKRDVPFVLKKKEKERSQKFNEKLTQFQPCINHGLNMPTTVESNGTSTFQDSSGPHW